MQFKIIKDPWTHFYSKNFVDLSHALEMGNAFPKWESKIWDAHGKEFRSNYAYKKELTNRNNFPESIYKFLLKLETKEFVEKISLLTGIKNLLVDKNLYGGGLNIFPPGSYLKPHVDFNFNDEIKSYRAINLIYYLNNDYELKEGGEFELYNNEFKKVKKISPFLNTCVLFASNQKTPHGVGNIKNFYRKSISLWYYTKEPPNETFTKPHRTIWIE